MSETCGCCAGTPGVAPVAATPANRPGLGALAYRAGTHARFLQTMQARLSSQAFPALRGLTTRATTDPAIALLDAWATVADVLTFYQERIANEGYLRTATERRSILELARLVGYALRPGVASTVYLAYLLEDKQVEPVEIDAGMRAQSVPDPGEQPQSFETIETLTARREWNEMRPRLRRPQTYASLTTHQRLYVKGVATNLKPNDALVIEVNALGVPYRVVEVTPEGTADRTVITIEPWDKARVTPQAAVPTARAADLAGVRAAVKTFKDLKQFGLARDTDMVKRVLTVLRRLEKQLNSGASSERIAAFIAEDTVPKLQPRQMVAHESQFNVLAPWLDEMIRALTEVGGDLGQPSLRAREFATAAATARAPVGAGYARAHAVDRDALAGVIGALAKPGSIPPRNLLTFRRSLKTEFASRADAGVQMIGAFQPQLRRSLESAAAHAAQTAPDVLKVYVLRAKAALFGNTALGTPKFGEQAIGTGNPPKTMIVVESYSALDLKQAWGIDLIGDDAPVAVVALDAEYTAIHPDTWVLIEWPFKTTDTNGPVVEQRVVLAKAQAVKSASMQAQATSAKVTQLDLDTPWISEADKPWEHTDEPLVLRNTRVYGQPEELVLTDEILDEDIDVSTDTAEVDPGLPLDGFYSGLQSGRWMIVAGERTDVLDANNTPLKGVKGAELLMLAGAEHRPDPTVPGDTLHTYVRFAQPIKYSYKRDTVILYGNVVKATHGETRSESLGAGDGSQTFQTFKLKQPPLTFVSANTPTGIDSTLRVYVNDVEWHEEAALAGLGPKDRAFITRTDNEGNTLTVFGNGVQGARLPSGLENIRARYRTGIGLPGNVKAEQISLLVMRPLGVKGVINPMRASGGADKETGDQARRNVPLTVMSLDRLVSVQDYADFARTFAGIGKAVAMRLPNGPVHVTIAGAADAPIEKTSDLYANLKAALRTFGDPYQALIVDVRRLKFLMVEAHIKLAADYVWESVVTAVRAALLDTFSFEKRELGQPVRLSEVQGAIQSVSGVVYVDVDVLGGIPEMIEGALLSPQQLMQQAQTLIETQEQTGVAATVPVNLAWRGSAGAVQPAELVYLTPIIPATLILNQI